MSTERLAEVRLALKHAGFVHEDIYLDGAPSGRVSGLVVSARFAGQSQIERQRALWDGLRERLPADMLSGVTSILTMTPEEVDDDVRAIEP